MSQFGSFEASIMQNANLVKEPNNSMILVKAHPNMVGAQVLRKVENVNR